MHIFTRTLLGLLITLCGHSLHTMQSTPPAQPQASSDYQQIDFSAMVAAITAIMQRLVIPAKL